MFPTPSLSRKINRICRQERVPVLPPRSAFAGETTRALHHLKVYTITMVPFLAIQPGLRLPKCHGLRRSLSGHCVTLQSGKSNFCGPGFQTVSPPISLLGEKINSSACRHAIMDPQRAHARVCLAYLMSLSTSEHTLRSLVYQDVDLFDALNKACENSSPYETDPLEVFSGARALLDEIKEVTPQDALDYTFWIR